MLATRRPPGKKLALHWEFPGGKVERGESPLEALTREIAEELRISIDQVFPLHPVVHHYEFGNIELLPFVSRCIDRPVIDLTEHTALLWVPPEHAKSELTWAPADLPIIDQVYKWMLEDA